MMKAMKDSSKRIVTAGLVALAISAAVVVSCTTIIPNDPPPAPPTGMDPNGNPGDPAPAPGTVTPTPGTMPGTMDPMPVPNGMVGTMTPIETPVIPPAPEAVDAEKTLQAKLDAATAAVPGTKVKFIDCTASPCMARLEAKQLTAMRDLLAKVSQDNQGKVSFVVREQLDAYMGQTFAADVKIGAEQPRTAVPSDPAELLAN
jgi:hypothetical protein